MQTTCSHITFNAEVSKSRKFLVVLDHPVDVCAGTAYLCLMEQCRPSVHDYRMSDLSPKSSFLCWKYSISPSRNCKCGSHFCISKSMAFRFSSVVIALCPSGGNGKSWISLFFGFLTALLFFCPLFLLFARTSGLHSISDGNCPSWISSWIPSNTILYLILAPWDRGALQQELWLRFRNGLYMDRQWFLI